jgi:hypothetical protein
MRLLYIWQLYLKVSHDMDVVAVWVEDKVSALEVVCLEVNLVAVVIVRAQANVEGLFLHDGDAGGGGRVKVKILMVVVVVQVVAVGPGTWEREWLKMWKLDPPCIARV